MHQDSNEKRGTVLRPYLVYLQNGSRTYRLTSYVYLKAGWTSTVHYTCRLFIDKQTMSYCRICRGLVRIHKICICKLVPILYRGYRIYVKRVHIFVCTCSYGLLRNDNVVFWLLLDLYIVIHRIGQIQRHCLMVSYTPKLLRIKSFKTFGPSGSSAVTV